MGNANANGLLPRYLGNGTNLAIFAEDDLWDTAGASNSSLGSHRLNTQKRLWCWTD
ncbi:MAG: hypothetical protein ACYDEP_08415 [Acidimicrobiales bacterium]|jgi:hypothetical protein